jgi:negative regulator of sigma E activity
VSHNGHDDIAARLRREAAATAPERLRADVMMRVQAEPRPQRIRPRRSFGRSFASVAAAACILGALVFGVSRVDFGGSGSSSGAGGGSAAAGAGKSLALPSQAEAGKSADRSMARSPEYQARHEQAVILSAVPGPLRAAITGRARLASPLRHTFGALDPYHLRSGR